MFVLAKPSASKIPLKKHLSCLENNLFYAECTLLDPRFKETELRNKTVCDVVTLGLRNEAGAVYLLLIKDEEILIIILTQDSTG